VRNLTPDETAALNALGEAARLYAALPQVHPSDAWDFTHGIHACQNVILSRPSCEQTAIPEARSMPVSKPPSEYGGAVKQRRCVYCEQPCELFITGTPWHLHCYRTVHLVREGLRRVVDLDQAHTDALHQHQHSGHVLPRADLFPTDARHVRSIDAVKSRRSQ
jgi:hypothetical protein